MKKVIFSALVLSAIAGQSAIADDCRHVTKREVFRMIDRSPEAYHEDVTAVRLLDMRYVVPDPRMIQCFARVQTTGSPALLTYWISTYDPSHVSYSVTISDYYRAQGCHGNREYEPSLPLCTTDPRATPEARKPVS